MLCMVASMGVASIGAALALGMGGRVLLHAAPLASTALTFAAFALGYLWGRGRGPTSEPKISRS
jgi:hypothetical protein